MPSPLGTGSQPRGFEARYAADFGHPVLLQLWFMDPSEPGGNSRNQLIGNDKRPQSRAFSRHHLILELWRYADLSGQMLVLEDSTSHFPVAASWV